MSTISETLAIAMRHHQAGRLPEAERLYHEILRLDPHNADAMHLLGVIAHQVHKQEAAIDLIGRAIAVRPGIAAYHSNLGNALREHGKLDEAVACYRRALQIKPDYPEACSNLGNALQEQGKLDEAVACYRRALHIKPDYAEAHNNLGNALKGQGKLDEAAACYRRAIQIKPDFAEAHNSLGNTLKDRGKFDEAMVNFRRALHIKPDYAVAYYNLGNDLQERGKFDEAATCYKLVLEIKPDFAEAHNNLGIALQKRGNLDQAMACYRQALQIKPDYAEVCNNLGNALQEQGKLDEAVACYQQCLHIKRDYAEAHSNLGEAYRTLGELDESVAAHQRALQIGPDCAKADYNLGVALQDQGNRDEAVACYRRAIQIKPDYLSAVDALVHQLQHVCLWQEFGDLPQQVIEAVDEDPGHENAGPVSPFSLLTLPAPTTAKQQQQCARKWVEQRLKSAIHLGQSIGFAHPRGAKPRITLGYLSADFRAHATAHLVAELFEKHDRGRFAVFGYSYGPDDGSPMRQRLVDAFDRFVDVKDASFAEAARLIHSDEVDILVDLKGYTQHARSQIPALRPAPIQVNYLGYPGTMGAPFMDYILVDDFVVPPEQQPFFTEQLVHLPGCYQVNDSRREISSRTPSRAECGLPKKGFVFCCFNNSYKITPEVFDVWMRLLKAVRRSVLWLLEGNRYAPANLRREAEARGVAAERLVFAPRQPLLSEHLARHRLADLFLDTFPVNAHTTASDALWAGCPVLTIAGKTFVSRVAGSLLHTLGLPELVTTSLAEYEETALRLSRKARKLANLRTRLEANRTSSSLFDAGRFARNLEKAYVTMWEIHTSGEKPRAFSVSPT